jgi:uncharacterized membrane-anchored protein YhcB (DUF1043 family)
MKIYWGTLVIGIVIGAVAAHLLNMSARGGPVQQSPS